MLLSLQAQSTLEIVKDTAADLEEVREHCQLYEVRFRRCAVNPELLENALERTPKGKKLHQTQPQEQLQNVVRRQTFNHRTGVCIEDLQILPRKNTHTRCYYQWWTSFVVFTFGRFRHVKLSTRLGVVISWSSGPDETDQAPKPKRDDQSHRRVYLSEAEQAIV